MKRIQTSRSTVMKSIGNLTIGMMCLVLTMRAAIAAEPKSDEEFVGPFPSWSNVKTDFGAVGNGMADDTAALQKALDSFPAKSAVLYLPAGVYRITKGLTMTSHMFVAVTGEDPAKTIVKWGGSNEGVMLLCNGVRYSKIGRITWDGGGKPVTAVAHLWDGHTPNAATGLEHADEVYKDVAIGLRAGLPHFMDAECMVSRCKFLRCSNTGLLINSMNALDWWLWNCEFVGCRLAQRTRRTASTAAAISTSTKASSAIRRRPTSGLATAPTLASATTRLSARRRSSSPSARRWAREHGNRRIPGARR